MSTDRKISLPAPGGKPQTPAEIRREELFRTSMRGHLCSPNMTATAFIRGLRDGYFFMEGKQAILQLYCLQREYIPIVKDPLQFNVPKSVRQAIRREDFRVSTNREFEQVLFHCSEPRAGHKDDEVRWIGDDIKRLLRESHALGHAHSLEIWKDGALVGGVLGFQVNALFISLSVYSQHNGAGNAAYVELQKRLTDSGFLVHDTIVPSNIASFFGSRSRDYQLDFAMRRQATRKELHFPAEAALLPAEPAATRPDNAGKAQKTPPIPV